MATTLTGGPVEIALYDTTEETYEVIGNTTGDISVERDTTDAEWEEHGDPMGKRRELYETADLTFEMVVTDERGNIQSAEIMDAEGNIRRNVVHEEVRILYYEHFADMEAGDPVAIYRCADTQFKFETLNSPQDDIVTVEVTGWINGEHGFYEEPEV